MLLFSQYVWVWLIASVMMGKHPTLWASQHWLGKSHWVQHLRYESNRHHHFSQIVKNPIQIEGWRHSLWGNSPFDDDDDDDDDDDILMPLTDGIWILYLLEVRLSLSWKCHKLVIVLSKFYIGLVSYRIRNYSRSWCRSLTDRIWFQWIYL